MAIASVLLSTRVRVRLVGGAVEWRVPAHGRFWLGSVLLSGVSCSIVEPLGPLAASRPFVLGEVGAFR